MEMKIADHKITVNGYFYDVVACCTCGVHYFIPTILNQTAMATDRHMIFCPNGHSWMYRRPTVAGGKSKEDALVNKDEKVVNLFKKSGKPSEGPPAA